MNSCFRRLFTTLLAVLLATNLMSCSRFQSDSTDLNANGATFIKGGVDLTDESPIAKASLFLFIYDFAKDGETSNVCSAAAISKTLVITAAHCVLGGADSDSPMPKTKVIFVLKTLKFDWSQFKWTMLNSDQASAAGSSLVRVHPEYRGFKDGEFSMRYELNDIALIRVPPLPDSVVPAKLLTDRSLIKKRLRVTAAGYGPTRQDKKVKVQVLRKFETVTVSGIGTVTGQTLLRETNSHGTIPGDSGGPIFTEVNGELFLWAVNSNGAIGEPGRVEPTVRHLDWIARASAELDGSPIENLRLDFSAPSPTPAPSPSPTPNLSESSNVTQ